MRSGEHQARDYADLLFLGGRHYLSSGRAPTEPAVGSVVAVVKCSKAAHDSSARTEPEWTDPGSTAVPDGGAIYEVPGVPVECQVAARSSDGRLHVYSVMAQDRTANCPA